MTTPTVANNRLQDARGTQLCLLVDPWWPEAETQDQGDRVVMYPGYLGDNRVTHTRMLRITVDGVPYRRQDDYGFRFLDVKDDDTHPTDADGYCSCDPVEYHPRSYSQGEICEDCWMLHGIVIGIGKFECPHK